MNEKCPGCGALSGHAARCERKTPEEWRASALLYYESWLKAMQGRDDWRDAVCKQWDKTKRRLKSALVMAEGRCAILRHENNKLREKLREKKP